MLMCMESKKQILYLFYIKIETQVMKIKAKMVIITLILVSFNIYELSAACTINNCIICPSDTCYGCQNGYVLRNNLCNPICDQYCTNCASPGNCTACLDNATLNILTNTCQLNCTFGFSGRCKTCSNLYFCRECISNDFFLTNNSRYCSRVQNCGSNCLVCSSSNSSDTCVSCVIGYKVQKNGTNSSCIRDICFIPYCVDCLTVSTCNACAKNYVLTLSSTVCTPSCNIAQCFVCLNSTNCQSCNIGYSLINSKCIAVCSIANCSVCLSSSTCLLCSSGYTLSTFGKSCELSCNDQYCFKCSDATTCSSCMFGYDLSNGQCKRQCLAGYTANIQNACLKCSNNINNCSNCFVNNVDVFTCLQCQIGFYINSTGGCFPCNITNCLSCKSSSICSVCSYGYIASPTGSCSISMNCSVSNCQNCSNNNSFCLSCSKGFKVNSSDGTCIVNCQSGKLLFNGVCNCPIGSYSNGASCVTCPDYKCLNCTASTCSSCMKGYYASNTACVSCISDCLQCTDSTTCSACIIDYIYYDGKCTYFGNGFSAASNAISSLQTCPAGCNTCSFGVNNILACSVLTPGYSFQGINIIRCDELCLSCANQTVCLTCYPGYVLIGQKCISCLDSNAYSCSSTGLNFSLSCSPGYTVVYNGVDGQCKSCASNCLKCDINGAGFCDPGRCQMGYVQVVGTKNCTSCFQNCPICNQQDPSVCSSCGLRRYTNYKGLCLSCPAGCKDCSSNSVCSSCLSGYILTDSLCKQSPTWPCALGSNLNCTLCVKQYTLFNGKCNYNSSCTSTSTCTNCVFGYYLVLSQQSSSGKCVQCSNLSKIANCLTCDSSNTTKCFVCKDGYYVQSGVCTTCPVGCKVCSSKYYCSQTALGYYQLINIDGSYNGKISKCSQPCSTCDINKNYCLTCIEGYIINGSVCFSKKIVYYTIVFNLPQIFDKNDSVSTAYGKILNSIGLLKSKMCTNLPQRVKLNDPTCQKCLSFLKFSQGSISMSTAISATNYTNLSEAITDIQSKSLIPGGQVISSSVSSYGIYDQTPQAIYQYKTGLILAIVLPITFLILMVIVTIIYYIKTRKTDTLINLSSKKKQEPINPSSIQMIKQ